MYPHMLFVFPASDYMVEDIPVAIFVRFLVSAHFHQNEFLPTQAEISS